ncbi:MAG TPA: carboxypeptidase regulatory-like domain-containing protein [Bryobacteraceae bacterium]|nr:carboxypeptidase regulatory-like domain-containing protein [Bryobacteraceae bacterium]
MQQKILGILITFAAVCSPAIVQAQSLGNAGTLEGSVIDPSGAAVPSALVEIRNPVTGYSQKGKTDTSGAFRFTNVPPNPYHIHVTAAGFSPADQDVSVRTAIPVQTTVKLTVAGERSTVTVEATGADVLEVDPSAHTDTDRSLIAKLPVIDPAGGLTQAITYSTGGVVADANGLFHPVGDHSQTSFMVDGQPISDQQSKVFSTQLPTSAIQSMEIVTGTPDAEFGDKSSLIANITTRSGLGAGRTFGSVETNYGSFGQTGGSLSLGFGNAKVGDFLALDGTRSGRFLDTPEYTPFHDKGNSQTLFDRFDYQMGSSDVFHLNLFAARNWIQIPNTYDQIAQGQRQRVMTWSIAPGFQHTFNAHTLLTINPYVRKDEFFYYGSRDRFADTPSTQDQARQLFNWGLKSDLAVSAGRNDLKVGIDWKQTRLAEKFGFGITDFAFNPVCLDSRGDAAGPTTITNPARCAAAGLAPNPAVSLGLIPYDLTRGGTPFTFHAAHSINQYAMYIQDSVRAGNFTFKVGFRGERYDGITSDNGFEPRAGIVYHIKATGTVLRMAYARTFETPFNENLLLSSVTGAGGLAENVFGASAVPIQPGRRNQYNAGFQQAFGKYLLADADYFWKFTRNGFDYSTLLNTTITFPIAWSRSKLDGVTGRISTTNLGGFQAYWTFGHTRARYFPPETGGLISQGTPLGDSVFRIDHDQAFQSTVVARYQHKAAEWLSSSWRYDSGLVVSGVPDAAAALELTAAQQANIGLACGNVIATFGAPITTCDRRLTSTLLTLPQAGKENDDHNPDRVKPRHVLNLGIGSDNVFHSERHTKWTASLEIANLTNRVALYNFLSTFSGTHFLQPRTIVMRVGLVF